MTLTLTLDQLSTATGSHQREAEMFLPVIDAAMDEFEINTPARQAAFLAQIGHESGGLHWLREIWGPTTAQERYEGRQDLGNTEPGDGYKYRGRGLVQITGRANYAEAGEALGVDFVNAPELLENPDQAARSAAWFWKRHGLNELADADDFYTITRRINGGTNGYDERVALWDAAKGVLA